MSMPTKGEILFYWREWLFINDPVFDLCEPSCWACGYYYSTKYDLDNPYATDEEIKATWNKTPFQRCHIIPKSLGGTDEVANLFLLCKKCHDLAPDSTSRELFLQWVKSQNHYIRETENIEKSLQDFDLSSEERDEFLGYMNNIDILKITKTEEFSNMVGGHFNQQSGGYEMKTSSFIAALIQYFRKYK